MERGVTRWSPREHGAKVCLRVEVVRMVVSGSHDADPVEEAVVSAWGRVDEVEVPRVESAEEGHARPVWVDDTSREQGGGYKHARVEQAGVERVPDVWVLVHVVHSVRPPHIRVPQSRAVQERVHAGLSGVGQDEQECALVHHA